MRFFSFLQNIFFYRTPPVAASKKIYQLKNISKWSVYIQLSIMFHKLLSRTSVYLYMRGFRNRKKSCKINKDWQKRWSFYSKHVFQQTIYSLQKNHLFFQVSLAAWKVSKYRVTSGPYFPVLGLNTGKYGLEITPYLDTFHAVYL